MSAKTCEHGEGRKICELCNAKARISELEAWIKDEADRNDTCTFYILGRRVCDGCKCGRKVSK